MAIVRWDPFGELTNLQDRIGGALPEVTVALTPLSAYDALTAAAPVEEASA